MATQREDEGQPPQALKGRQTTGRRWSPQGRNPCIMGTPNQPSPERAAECGQIAQPRTAGQSGARGVRHPFGVPFRVVCAGYRGSAAAPPPACGLPPLRGSRRLNERVIALQVKRQVSFLAAGRCRSQRRTDVVPSGGRLSFPAEVDCRSLRRAIVIPSGGQVNLTR